MSSIRRTSLVGISSLGHVFVMSVPYWEGPAPDHAFKSPNKIDFTAAVDKLQAFSESCSADWSYESTNLLKLRAE